MKSRASQVDRDVCAVEGSKSGENDAILKELLLELNNDFNFDTSLDDDLDIDVTQHPLESIGKSDAFIEDELLDFDYIQHDLLDEKPNAFAVKSLPLGDFKRDPSAPIGDISYLLDVGADITCCSQTLTELFSRGWDVSSYHPKPTLTLPKCCIVSHAPQEI